MWRIGGGWVGGEGGPGRSVGVPPDERRNRADKLDCMRKEVPDDLVDRAVMRIDQKRPSLVVGLPRIAGQMNFLDVRKRISVDIGNRIPQLIGRCDVDIVDVEKKAAPRSSHHFGY